MEIKLRNFVVLVYLLKTNWAARAIKRQYNCEIYSITSGVGCVWPGGGYSHNWAWQRGSVVMTPVFEIFNPIGSIFYTSTQSD